jgi:2-polyprenyl-3-methyl-5-hydroxy-6-metoxy-1,4-benzoquinol methylase
MKPETQRERDMRRNQRILFDGVAPLYQASRPGYPSHVVEFVVATAGLDAGSTVLEIGCGTGQLTELLAGYGFELTAIDIGPSMIAAAQSQLEGSAVSFHASSFEDLAAADETFDLIIASAAFHWIDPEVRFVKSARLLRPGGWLALISTDERYDDPLGAALGGMWAARGDTDGAWAQPATNAEIMAATGLFAKPLDHNDARRVTRSADIVIGVENTRATSLSWPDDVRREFTEELSRALESKPEVDLTLRTTVTMAEVLKGAAG